MKRNADETLKPFEFRPVQGQLPAFRGMYRRGDPASCPPNQFHLLINARTGEGDLSSRSGLSLVINAGVEGCITGLWDLDNRAVGGTCYPAYAPVTEVDVVPLGVAQFNTDKDPFSKAWKIDINGLTTPFPTENHQWPPYSWGTWYLTSTIPFGSPPVGSKVLGPFQAFVRWRGRTLIPIWEPATDQVTPHLSNHSIYDITFDPDEPDELSTARIQLIKEDWPHEPTGSGATGNIDGGAYIHSMTVRQERRDNPLTGNPETIDVLYIGTADGKVMRYDGTSVETVFTFTVPCNVRVFCYFQKGIVAAGGPESGYAYQEDTVQPWVDEDWPDVEQGDPPGYFLCTGIAEAFGEVVFFGARYGKYFGFVATSGLTPCAMRWSGAADPPVLFWTYDISGAEAETYPVAAALLGGVLWFATVFNP